MAEDDARATGVHEALIGDLLLGLGVEEPWTLTPDQRIAEIARAVKDGRISAEKAAGLRALGLLPPE
jgi:hypothetical protein